MPIDVKDASTAAAKWMQRAQSAAPDYANGVKNAGSKWQTNTVAAEQTWGDGVTAAVGSKRFSKGVSAQSPIGNTAITTKHRIARPRNPLPRRASFGQEARLKTHPPASIKTSRLPGDNSAHSSLERVKLIRC